tara:strand:+ start:469 stop:1236 length:768 start_codon:yes stop_codon:yes gene_type:complete
MAIGRPVSLTNNVASKTISVTATAGQTLFTVAGGYRINQLLVYRNGVKLAQSNDFIASDGATVTLVTPANAGDNVDFQVFDDFKVADAIVSAASSQTIQGDLAVNGNLYFNNNDLDLNNINASGIVTAVGGFNIGIQSAGVDVATGVVTALNFVGAGNTFAYDSTSKTVDISIAGGGGGGLGTAINYESGEKTPFSYIDRTAEINENLLIDASNAGESDSIIISIIPNIEVNAGVALTVGAGKTMVIDALQIGDL